MSMSTRQVDWLAGPLCGGVPVWLPDLVFPFPVGCFAAPVYFLPASSVRVSWDMMWQHCCKRH